MPYLHVGHSPGINPGLKVRLELAAGEAEIGDLGSLARIQEDVCRFQVCARKSDVALV